MMDPDDLIAIVDTSWNLEGKIGSGNIVQEDGYDQENIDLFKENTVDAAKEKHVPVIEKVEGGFR